MNNILPQCPIVLTYDRSLAWSEDHPHHTQPGQIVETRNDRLYKVVLQTGALCAVVFHNDLVQTQVTDAADLQVTTHLLQRFLIVIQRDSPVG